MKDSDERLAVAKELFKTLCEEEQADIQINDTKYPELLAMHQIAVDEYETARKRYQTNQSYLDKFQKEKKNRQEGAIGSVYDIK